MSVKTKSVAKKTMKDPELITLFNQMVGTGDPDPAIVIPKYEKLLEETKKATMMLRDFANLSKSPFANAFHKDYRGSFEEITTYAEGALQELDGLTIEEQSEPVVAGKKLSDLNQDNDAITKYLMSLNSKYDLAELRDAYSGLKECRPVQELVMITRNLKDVLMMEKERRKTKNHDLEDKDSLSMMFIQKCEGDSLTLFNFSSLDFKQISYDEDALTPQLARYMLTFLHILYKKGLEVVRIITSPDIDVDKFSEVLVRNIGEVKKQIPRCDKAFDKIANSVDLLKGNFDEYYKDFVISQNPGIIIESFVGDVAKNSSADVQTTAQFRKIINFYKQKMQGQVKDPKIKKILNMVSSNLDVLEEKTGGSSRKKEDRDSQPEHDMSDPEVRREVQESFLPDYVKNMSSAKKKPTSRKNKK